MRKPTIKTLKRKLWETFSVYIRLRDSDGKGYCRCISCGEVKPYKEMDAGHFIPKSRGLSIYFYEDNVHAQCRQCNTFQHGNLYKYGKALEGKIGDKAIKEIEKLSKTIRKFTLAEYQGLIDYYKDQIDVLKTIKML
jgi:5-methylcytosine-specific restriction endonuclease McrA